jgi:hypothetical protein
MNDSPERSAPLIEVFRRDLDCRAEDEDHHLDVNEERSGSQVVTADGCTDALHNASGTKVRVWVYYNPATQEITLYDSEPPESFGRREHDVGPIELDEDLITSYLATKEIWDKAHDAFVAAVKAATGDR